MNGAQQLPKNKGFFRTSYKPQENPRTIRTNSWLTEVSSIGYRLNCKFFGVGPPYQSGSTHDQSLRLFKDTKKLYLSDAIVQTRTKEQFVVLHHGSSDADLPRKFAKERDSGSNHDNPMSGIRLV